jgi:hypothetical protein
MLTRRLIACPDARDGTVPGGFQPGRWSLTAAAAWRAAAAPQDDRGTPC